MESICCCSATTRGDHASQATGGLGAHRPERWLDSERGGADSSFSFLPFGAGPRGCLGTRLGLTEAVVGVAKILRGFSLRFDRAGPLRYKYDLTLNLGDSTTCSVRERRA